MIRVSHYDEDTDSFIVSSIQDNEKVRKNFSFDDFVISTTGNGKVVSLEVRDFSGFLEESGLDIENVKKNLDSVNLVVKPQKDLLFIGLGLDKNSPLKRIPIANIPMHSFRN